MHLFFSAGDPSGDQHAAPLIAELRRRVPHLRARGYGGPAMEAVGLESDHRLTDLAVMGFRAVLPHLRTFRRLAREADAIFRAEKPDAVVLVDFPGFNWHLARAAKRAGVPVVYYLPPQMWAWAPWRVRKIRRDVGLVLCALPFEPAWYADRGVSAEDGIPVRDVGHPFFDEVAQHPLDTAFLAERRGGRTVGVLPGSRDGEVAKNGPVLARTVRTLSALHPDVTFRVAAHRPHHAERMRALLTGAGIRPSDRSVEVCVGRTSEIVELSDCCAMVSGSVSLELLARRTPGAVLYRTTPLAHTLLRPLINCEFLTLVNLIAGSELFPEFIPTDADPVDAAAPLTRVLDGWLSNPEALALKRESVAALAARVVKPGAHRRAAGAILKHLGAGRAAVRRAA